MKASYKFRIYPTKDQEVSLKKTIGCCRYVYNWSIKFRQDFFKENKKHAGFVKTSSELTKLRKNVGNEWLNEVSYTALQQSIRDNDRSFLNFLKKRSSYPKFKSKRTRSSARFVKTSFYLKNGKFRLNKIKKSIKVNWSRELPSKPSSCTISLNPSGQWFVSFLCETEIEKLPPSSKKVGIDLGIETFATLSGGTKVKQPDFIRKSRKKLTRAQRNQSRKKLGSKNRDKARIKVAKVHQKISNVRNDFLKKLSTQLIRENQTILIEDLTVSKMVKNRRLARLISEQGWREFRTMLEYKAEWYGRELIVIDKFSPTSQTCNACGKINKVSLDKRKFTCECGVTYDRDENAARNILAAGIAVSACGVDVRPVLNGRLTLKQEVFKLN